MLFTQMQSLRMYTFLAYIFFVILFGLEELFTYNTNIDCSKEYRTVFMGVEIFEAVVSVLSVFGILVLIKDIRNSNQEIEEAKLALANSKSSQKKFSPEIQQFWEGIQSQFKEWKLSQSEKEIAILMLRGFTNPQIAALREKSIKTIENQMFSIFQKSSTTGKLDFISYFLSPLLPEEE